MTHLIDKDTLVAEIERLKECNCKICDGDFDFLKKTYPEHYYSTEIYNDILSFLDSLEVKTDKDNSLEKFKSLQHITGDLRQTLEDWGYAPNLYYFDGSWHVDWISCKEGDSIKCFTANTAEEAINEAYNWFHSTFCNS